MAASYPELDEQRTLFLHYAPGLNYPFLELFAAMTGEGEEYFVQMFHEWGYGVSSPSVGENEARTTFTLWSRGLELPENVFGSSS